MKGKSDRDLSNEELFFKKQQLNDTTLRKGRNNNQSFTNIKFKAINQTSDNIKAQYSNNMTNKIMKKNNNSIDNIENHINGSLEWKNSSL